MVRMLNLKFVKLVTLDGVVVLWGVAIVPRPRRVHRRSILAMRREVGCGSLWRGSPNEHPLPPTGCPQAVASRLGAGGRGTRHGTSSRQAQPCRRGAFHNVGGGAQQCRRGNWQHRLSRVFFSNRSDRRLSRAVDLVAAGSSTAGHREKMAEQTVAEK